MQRSNNSAVPPGVSTRPARQLNQPQQNQPLPYAQPHQHQPPAQQQVPPTDQLSQHVHRQSAQRPASYAPQFDPYQAQQAPASNQQSYAPQPYDHQAQPAQPQRQYAEQQSYAQPPQPYAQQAGTQQAHNPAYDQWTEPAGAQHSQHGYDLGGFAAPQHDAHYQQHDYDPNQQSAGDWAHAQGHHEPSLDHGAYQQDPHGAGSLDHHEEYADDEEGYEYEDAPRGRFMKIAAALVGAIVVGGGLAFAYTSLIVNESGKPPVIKSASGPSKIKPADPGGKKFANSDSKLMGRLNEGSDSGPDTSGVKKVAVVPVSPDGTIMAPTVTAANNTTANDAFPVAGATLAPPGATLADAALTVAPPGGVQKPAQQVAAKAVETLNAAKAAAPAAPEMKLAAPPPPPAKKVVAAAAAPAPTVKKPSVPATTAAVPAATGAGYVAVLASVPVSNTSRIAALQQFADMQQKYGSVLQNKMPDVREANLGAKGTYHRLVVGPPGSRQGAQAFCGSLKAAGYGESCWVTAY